MYKRRPDKYGGKPSLTVDHAHRHCAHLRQTSQVAWGMDPCWIHGPRCFFRWFDDAIFSLEWKEAIWARFYMGAPPRQRWSKAEVVRNFASREFDSYRQAFAIRPEMNGNLNCKTVRAIQCPAQPYLSVTSPNLDVDRVGSCEMAGGCMSIGNNRERWPFRRAKCRGDGAAAVEGAARRQV
jgi:hypothetical protein